MTRLSPRCGRLLQRNERAGPVLEDPVCGRPEGHPGHCLSEAYWARKITANKYWAQTGRRPARPAGSPAVAAAIRSARIGAGLSQFRLGMMLGVSQQAVHYWEAAKWPPSAENWQQLELALGPLGVVRDTGPGPEAAAGEEAA